MKKNTLLLLALAGGALILLSMKGKKMVDIPKRMSYQIDVPEPEKLSEEQFYKGTEEKGLLDRLKPILKSVIAKAKEKRAARKKIGFPDLY